MSGDFIDRCINCFISVHGQSIGCADSNVFAINITTPFHVIYVRRIGRFWIIRSNIVLLPQLRH
jgi:hypothetical protein